MKKVISKSLKSFMLSFGFLALVGCSINTTPTAEQDKTIGNSEKEVIEVENTKVDLPLGKYNEGVVLVKKANFNKAMLGELEYKNVEQLYKNSPWQKIELKNTEKTSEAIEYLSSLNVFEKVEYDYVMGSDGEIESIDVSGNPNSNEQGYLESQGIFDGWGYQMANNMTPGGSPDVVVAVIDTGVDYNHIDLRNNIWTNSGEIPNNGIDDDNNGYVDDVHGWDCVGNDADPMDDNGHGTHVAGIIAAENNTVGTVGIAFNCKIMCLKAGNSSGYFNSSDIVKAVQYAYMNGASVINMSFGGSSISKAVEDVLEDAYYQCLLVAAAGNDGLCNNLDHANKHDVGVSYPAALPYVIGVMSTNQTGSYVSNFSNYDDTPYDKHEYEAYACGEQIPSTWPNNKVARLSGTSMASPVVSGIAALLRSTYQDRDTYSNKFIQSQIVNSGSINPYNSIAQEIDYAHNFVNAYEALTKIPKPSVSLYDYYIFDNVDSNPVNNGDGTIDAGETVHLAIELHNRGGVASNVFATISTMRNNDPDLIDPYIEIRNASISLGNIGTYSVRDCGKIYENDIVVGTTHFFEIVVSSDCPNDYLAKLNIHLNYNNGLDEADFSNYESDGYLMLNVSNGVKLPQSITTNTRFPGNKRYILSSTMSISSGTEVVFEAGSIIQFYEGTNAYYNSLYSSPVIKNYGTLIFEGTAENKISILPSERFNKFTCEIDTLSQDAITAFYYCDYTNPTSNTNLMGSVNVTFDYCNLRNNEDARYIFDNGSVGWCYPYITSILLSNSVIEFVTYSNFDLFDVAEGNEFIISSGSNIISVLGDCSFKNNVIISKAGGKLSIPHSARVENNIFTTVSLNDPKVCASIEHGDSVTFVNNVFLNAYRLFGSQVIKEYTDSNGIPFVNIENEVIDYSKCFPIVKDISIYNSDNQTIKVIGNETVRFVVTFSREMDVENGFNLYFGSRKPFSDYKINGAFTSSTVWEGEFTLKANIENGLQYFKFGNISAADDQNKELYNLGESFTFDIDTTSAMSMSIQAIPTENGIELTWLQDDYDTLMGYNVYRSTYKDGNFVKLNNFVIPAGENTFTDKNAEPGVLYWYTFTVVFSDMTESAPAGKVSCTALDTIVPSIYHTPVNQGYLNNNLVISCTASDNIGIQNVTLYYKTKGQAEWKSLSMLKQNDRYSATIYGSELSLEGLEYYIVASDGVNSISKGSSENPYSVIIKDASAISQLGDVDGDGVVTTKDALMIMQSINGDLLLTDDQFRRADLNKDGILSSVEALRILQYINGNVATLEM